MNKIIRRHFFEIQNISYDKLQTKIGFIAIIDRVFEQWGVQKSIKMVFLLFSIIYHAF